MQGKTGADAGQFTHRSHGLLGIGRPVLGLRRKKTSLARMYLSKGV